MNGAEGEPGRIQKFVATAKGLPLETWHRVRKPLAVAIVTYAATRTGAVDFAIRYVADHSGPLGDITSAAAEKIHGENKIHGLVYDKALPDQQLIPAAPIKWEKGLGPQDDIKLSVDGSYLLAVIDCDNIGSEENVCPVTIVAVSKDVFDQTGYGQGVSLSKDLPHTRISSIIKQTP